MTDFPFAYSETLTNIRTQSIEMENTNSFHLFLLLPFKSHDLKKHTSTSLDGFKS